jgi:hypothetical protein
MNFFTELKRRNPLLFWFGLFNLAVAVLCLVLIPFEETQILGVNRWLKPFKFYSTVGIMILTMGWLMHYMDIQKKVKRYSRIMAVTMFFENGLIMMQAIRNTTSHFNNTSVFNGADFNIMGILIAIFTVIVILVCISFFRQKQFSIPMAYVWGIRLGLLFFIIFSLEGGVMVGLLKHTIGAADGSAGLPLLNWSIEHGDLRVAHFLGLHSLQVLPLFGNYISRSKDQTLLFSALYFVFCVALFLQAINGIPLFF